MLHMTWHLVKRDFQLRYAGSLLGFLWSLAIPISQLLTLVFVFSKVIPLDIPNFPVFVFTALLPWSWFSSSLLGASNAFVGSRDLLRYPNFPPAVVVAVNTASHLLTFLVSLPVLFGMLYWYDIEFPLLFLPAFPLLLFVQGMLITGLGFMIATSNVYYRDISQLMGILVALLFFITPIWYAVPLKGEYNFLFQINPMSLIIQNYRLVLLDGQWLDWPSLIMAALSSIGILCVGYFIYRRLQPDMIDAL